MSKHVILFLAANPYGTSPLRLAEECAAIQRELKMASHRDDFQFESRWAVGIDELMRHLLDLQPVILHFSGHSDAQGLLLVGDDGQPQPVTPAALAHMVRSAASTVRLAVLNACYADLQAEALRDVVGCAIGMKGNISDDAARAFAVGFYRALGYRRSVGNAYMQAEATLEGKGMSADAQSRCLARSGINVDTLVLGGDLEDAARAPHGQSGNPVDIGPPEDPVDAYVRFGLRRHSRALIVGFPHASIPIDLDRVFVPLSVYADRARMGAGRRSSATDVGMSHGGAELSFDEALACANDGRTCLALLGDPGAGKTTLLRHLFCTVARKAVAGPTAHLRDLHPVMVRLSSITHDEQVSRGLARVVVRVAAEDGYPDAGPAILARPGQGFLFLLDGLDEVRDASTRERVCAWLNDEIDHWSSSMFVVTSRRAAWALTPALASRFLPVSVQGLHGDAVAAYVKRWFHAVAYHFFAAIDPPTVIEAQVRERTAALLEAFAAPSWRSKMHLIEMTANPLMLSTLCLACYNDNRLPTRRGELYERALKLLIDVWTRERTSEVLQFDTARLILEPLAYEMQLQDRRELTMDEAVAHTRGPWTRLSELHAVAPTPERFLELLRDECGVLTSRGSGRLEFVHLAFQEYLAAAHVASCGLGRVLAHRAGDPRWEEVILLAVSRPGVFEPFMHRAFEGGDVDVTLLRQCLREAITVASAPFEVAAERALERIYSPDLFWTRFVRWLQGRPKPPPATGELRRVFEVAQGYDLPRLVEKARWIVSNPDPALRAVARRILSQKKLMHAEATTPREGHPFVEPTTGMSFVWIPAGEFTMGSSNKPGQPSYDPDADRDEAPAHRVRLTGFWMSIFPVTNEVYARFVTETAHATPKAFADRRFNDPAQPVVTVTWHDTLLFTDWLTDQLTGVVAHVPTEAEWEFAARGSDGRRYPWGNDSPDASRATFAQPFETGRPAAVGHTPDGKSPFDVHDLAGNVREWCLDVGASSYAKAGAVDPRDYVTYSDSRAVRGGSWNLGSRGLRSAFRGSFDPQHEDLNLGFRIVCESVDRKNRVRADAVLELGVAEPPNSPLLPSALSAQQENETDPGAAVHDAAREDVGQAAARPTVKAAEPAVQEDALAVPAYRLHSLAQILTMQTFAVLCFGTPFAGVWMVFRNFKKLNQPKRARITLGLGLLSFVLLLTIMIKSRSPFRFLIAAIFNIILAVLTCKISRATQGKAISNHERQGGKFASRWSAFGVWLTSLAVVMSLAFVILGGIEVFKMTRKVDFPGGSNVYYRDGTTEVEARALGNALVQLGFFGKHRASVIVSHESDRWIVSFVVADFVFHNSEIETEFHKMAESLSKSAFANTSIDIRLIDTSFNSHIVLTWESRPRVIRSGEGGEVWFENGVLEKEAQSFSQQLDAGLLAGRQPITLNRNGETVIVRFTMKKTMLDDSDVQLRFHGYADRFSECCFGGRPIGIWLLDESLTSKVKLTWETRPRQSLHHAAP